MRCLYKQIEELLVGRKKGNQGNYLMYNKTVCQATDRKQLFVTRNKM